MIPARSTLALARTAGRSSSRSAAIQQQFRSAHYVNKVGDNMPFKYRGPGQTKAKVATKVGLYFGVGFSLPFGIAYYQMKKSGAIP